MRVYAFTETRMNLTTKKEEVYYCLQYGRNPFAQAMTTTDSQKFIAAKEHAMKDYKIIEDKLPPFRRTSFYETEEIEDKEGVREVKFAVSREPIVEKKQTGLVRVVLELVDLE
jgi:hypothetical protein